jgi:hypothetical protein
MNEQSRIERVKAGELECILANDLKPGEYQDHVASAFGVGVDDIKSVMRDACALYRCSFAELESAFRSVYGVSPLDNY